MPPKLTTVNRHEPGPPVADSQHDASLQADCLHRCCPFCGRDNRRGEKSRYSRGRWLIKHCADCGLVYLENVLPYGELVERHAWVDSAAAEREFRRRREPAFSFISRQANRWKLAYARLTRRNKCYALIKRYVRRGRVLDVGCGNGAVLRNLDGRFIPFGIEIGEKAAHAAGSHAAERGGKVIHGDALSGLRRLAERDFDGVVMKSFLEHENQPQAVLDQAARVLRPGGCLIIKVPNFASFNRIVRGSRWSGFRYPDHVNYFTPATLRAMVTRAGLEIVRFSLADRLPTSDNMWLVAGKMELPV